MWENREKNNCTRFYDLGLFFYMFFFFYFIAAI